MFCSPRGRNTENVDIGGAIVVSSLLLAVTSNVDVYDDIMDVELWSAVVRRIGLLLLPTQHTNHSIEHILFPSSIDISKSM